MTPEILLNTPPRNLELVNGEAHVFCTPLDEPPARLEHYEKMLSQGERARAGRFILTRDRNRFVAARAALREILGGLLRADPARLVFACGEHGKPRLAAPVGGKFLHFNLAHSDALAVYLVSARDEVGVDVERVRPIRDAEAIAAQFFPERENAEWRSLPDARRPEAFFEYWTRKEALLKAVGCGLGGLNQVPPISGEVAPKLNSPDAAWDFSNYFVHHFTPASGYTAATATKSACAPCCWKWPVR